jgi:predicted N-acetyltransferase YhbS
MKNIAVRQMTLADCMAVSKVYRDEPGWWGEVEKCHAITENELAFGYYITVAERDGDIVGHAEWLADCDESVGYLYLAELQVLKSAQRSGVGRLLVEDGVRYAKECGLPRIVTMPEQDTGSEVFYAKCGFIRCSETLHAAMEVPLKGCAEGYTRIEKVPYLAIRDKRLILGLSHVSARHMWRLLNDPVSFDPYTTASFQTMGGDYVQFRINPNGKHAIALLWCSEPSPLYIKDVLNCAAMLGLDVVETEFFSEYRYLFDGFAVKTKASEIIMSRIVPF